MPTITARVEGADELKAKLEALGTKARGAILERAGEAGAEVIRAAAEANAPGPHIELALSRSAEYAVEFEIGPDMAHWYYQFFETGAGRHTIEGNTKMAVAFLGADGEVVREVVDHPGMKAKPFLRPAIDAKGDEATQVVGRILRREIESVASG